MNIGQELVDEIKNNQIILFAGAGLSMNLGLPSWSKLIDHMSEDLDIKSEDFQKMGNYLELAEYYQLTKGTIGPLRSWMDTNFHSENIKIKDSKAHELITQMKFPIIYTTNYDRWIEKSFDAFKEKYDKITNIFDFTQIHGDRTQIIKYHGDFDDDSSIVLTETSYFKRLALDTPLDMKLRTDSLGKSLLFIGYSLNDIDIRYLLYKLQLLWGDSLEKSMQPKSYIFLAKGNPVQEKILTSRGIESIISDDDDPGKGLVNFLESLKAQAFGS
ncbi:Sir2 family NAD-dependent protein deacetylase [Halobacteriovorax marinus]|uniref:Sir2 family NAD-dependent protein deacetylase n=1 Tax=Halobacteriovorax marinus TaxID=97084 RepID=A0A1Y5F550_9BACT|nr:Sir2 family NAD-dependent protein deacetylase [Halobacteriovorax marinus]